MIVRMDVWDLVRDRFSEAEKAALNAAVDGIVICPRSAVLDERALAPELAAKLRGLADLPQAQLKAEADAAKLREWEQLYGKRGGAKV